MMIAMYFWYGALVAMNALDVLTTRIAISMGAHEANPVMAPVVDHLWVFKILFLLLAFAIMWYVEKNWKDNGWKPVCAGACVTAIAVVSNSYWIVSNL